MKSYLTYITEVDKGPKFGQSSPDGGDADRFKITNYLDKNKKKNPLKDAMDSLDAQRSASPDNRPPGTPKTPKPANDADLNFFTPEEEAELKKISGDVEDAKKQISASDVESKLQKNLSKAETNYDKILKDAGISPETPPDASPTNVSKVDDYTPEELARRDKIRASIDAAAERGKTTVASDVAKVTQKAEPGMLSRLGTIARTVAKNPLVRAGGKLLGAASIPLGIYGIYQDSQTAGDMQVKNVEREMKRAKQQGRQYREPLPTNPGFKF